MTAWPERWVIEQGKLTKYLLNIEHRDGAAKAEALLRAGFNQTDPKTLARALLEHVRTGSHVTSQTAYGSRFIFEGPLLGPIRVISFFRSVWLVRSGERIARLVTAYPFDERKSAAEKTR